MVMELENGRMGSSKSRTAKHQLRGVQSSVVGGGLVVGIATVVAVGLAGKLFSKLRKPKHDSAEDSPPYLTPAGSLDDIVLEKKSDLQIRVEGVTLPSDEVLINGKSYSYLDLQDGDSDSTSDSRATPADLHMESSPEAVIRGQLSTDHLHSDDCEFLIHQNTKDVEDSSTASAVALSALLTNALQDAKHESPSKHELLSNTKGLEDGIVGVISRAFEDFNYGDTSSEELTPTKVTLSISWETNSFTSSEEEGAQAHPEEFVAENGILRGSIKEEAEELVSERIVHDGQVSQDEELAPENGHSSAGDIEEQEEEVATRTGENETRRGISLHATGTSVGGRERTNPELVAEGQEDKIEHEGSVKALVNNEIQGGVSQLDEVIEKETAIQDPDHFPNHADNNNESQVSVEVTSNLPRSTESSVNDTTEAKGQDTVHVATQTAQKEGSIVAVIKKETARRDSDDDKKHPDRAEDAKLSVIVTSSLLRSLGSFPNGNEAAKDEENLQIATPIVEKQGAKAEVTAKETTSEDCDGVRKPAGHVEDVKVSVNSALPSAFSATVVADCVQISTHITEKEGETRAVTSLVLPVTCREVATEIVTTKAHKFAAGPPKAVEDSGSATAGGSNPKLDESRRGKHRLSLEVLGLALIIALIAILLWSIEARGNLSVLRLD